MDNSKNYKIYKITEKSTGNICFIGKTKKTLNNAFLSICNANNKAPITELIKDKGRHNFEIAFIKEDLSNTEANDLEKKLIRKASRKYELYNQNLYQDKEVINTTSKNSDNASKNVNQRREVRCITTGEVFPSGLEACIKYHMTTSSLFHALNNNEKTAGFDDDDNPLRWEYTDGNVKRKEKLPYTVYVIYQRINGKEWKPIYVGATKMSLNRRLSTHYANKAGSLYELLNKIRKEDIKIETYKEFSNQEEATALANKLIDELRERFKLYNKHDKSSDERKKLHSKRMAERSKEQFELGLKVTGSQPILCLNDRKIYKSLIEARKVYNLDDHVLNKACDEILYSYKGKFFQRINPYKEPIQTNTYTLYALIRYGKIRFIFYSKYTVLNLEEAIKESNYYEEIKNITNNSANIDCRVLCHNLKTEEEAEEMRNFFLNVLQDYNDRQSVFTDTIISQGRIICEETGKYFDSANAAVKEYDVSRTSLKRVLNGASKHVFSDALDCYLHFKYENACGINSYEGKLNLYYILYKEAPVAAIVTKIMSREILPYYKTNKKNVFYQKMKELGYDNFSLELVHTNIASKEEGKQLKQAHINLLSTLGFELFSYIV